MGRPDWRAMLAGMSSTEYADWRHFYRTHYFQDAQLDMHFAGLTYAVLSLFFVDPDLKPSDFSLLNEQDADDITDETVCGEMMMSASEGIAGGVRYGG